MAVLARSHSQWQAALLLPSVAPTDVDNIAQKRISPRGVALAARPARPVSEFGRRWDPLLNGRRWVKEGRWVRVRKTSECPISAVIGRVSRRSPESARSTGANVNAAVSFSFSLNGWLASAPLEPLERDSISLAAPV